MRYFLSKTFLVDNLVITKFTYRVLIVWHLLTTNVYRYQMCLLRNWIYCSTLPRASEHLLTRPYVQEVTILSFQILMANYEYFHTVAVSTLHSW